MEGKRWEVFKKGPARNRASFGSLKTPRLYIGMLIRRKGFDVMKRYDLMFDRSRNCVGLVEVDSGGFGVRKHGSQHRVITCSAFCSQFDLTGRYIITDALRDADGVWNLYLTEDAR